MRRAIHKTITESESDTSIGQIYMDVCVFMYACLPALYVYMYMNTWTCIYVDMWLPKKDLIYEA